MKKKYKKILNKLCIATNEAVGDTNTNSNVEIPTFEGICNILSQDFDKKFTISNYYKNNKLVYLDEDMTFYPNNLTKIEREKSHFINKMKELDISIIPVEKYKYKCNNKNDLKGTKVFTAILTPDKVKTENIIKKLNLKTKEYNDFQSIMAICLIPYDVAINLINNKAPYKYSKYFSLPKNYYVQKLNSVLCNGMDKSETCGKYFLGLVYGYHCTGEYTDIQIIPSETTKRYQSTTETSIRCVKEEFGIFDFNKYMKFDDTQKYVKKSNTNEAIYLLNFTP